MFSSNFFAFPIKTTSTEISKNCVYVWLTWVINFFFDTTGYNCSINVAINSFQFAKHSSAIKYSVPVLLSEPLWMELSEKCRHDWFFSQLKPKIHQNYRLRFLNQYLSRHSCTYKLLVDCRILCKFFRTENWYGEMSSGAYSYEPSCLTDLILFKITFRISAIMERISICRILFNDNVPWKCHWIVIFIYQYSEKLELVWFFQEKHTCLSQRPVAFFLLLKTYGNFNCCVWFLATKFW